MDEPTRILVVDDESNLADLVATALRYAGFTTATAGSGSAAVTQVAEFRPHLVILDVMLPDFDGFEVSRRLAEGGSHAPILFLTARDATEDKVRGLTVGGDDYVTKPFSLDELIARVRVILRRSGHQTESHNLISFADLEMDEDLREVRRGGELVELTATEYRLLRYLLINARRVLTRAQILDHVWKYDFGGDAGILETYISYLRKKVDRQDPPLIHTIRGMGYVLRLPRA
ncbi:MAG TPA: response regulator transcription factor [Candidatus Dormibacteraeota bacterium]|nr:response regulator transcription factor [Candidatus Dormibacteraeota bacterium]